MKTIYLIWKAVDSNVRNDAEVVGVFTGEDSQADALLEKMNSEDESCRGGAYPYYRTEPAVITTKNVSDFLPH